MKKRSSVRHREPLGPDESWRQWVQRQPELGGREITNVSWAWVEREHYVEDAEREDEGPEELLQAVVRLLDVVSGDRQERSARRRPPVDPDAREADLAGSGVGERADAMAFIRADIAREDREVRRFRMTYLHGRPLPSELLDAFMTSPLTTLMGAWGHTIGDGIPLEHLSTAVATRERGHGGPDEVLVVRLGIDRQEGKEWWAEAPLLGSVVVVEYATPDRTARTTVRADSVLGELHALAHKLAKGYGWHAATAAAFILEDAIPAVRPLRATVAQSIKLGVASHQASVTITVEPWVPVEVVTRLYRSIQEELVPSGKRRLQPVTLELIRFVYDARRQDPEVTWRQLWTRWNASHSLASIRTREHFARRVRQAERAVVPRYQFGVPAAEAARITQTTADPLPTIGRDATG